MRVMRPAAAASATQRCRRQPFLCDVAQPGGVRFDRLAGHESLEIAQQLRRAAVALRRLLREALENDGVEIARNRRVERARGARLRVGDQLQRLADGAPAERDLAHQQFVEDRSETVDVGAVIDRLPSQLLRRQIVGRPRDLVPVLGRATDRLREAEVDDDAAQRTLLVGRDENIAGFDVAVDQPLLVRGAQCVRDLLDQADLRDERELCAPSRTAAGRR